MEKIEGWFRKNSKQNKSIFESQVTNSKFGAYPIRNSRH